jgi:hypothetical protein
VREGANVNLGLLNELAERVLGRILGPIAVAQAEDGKRVAVMLGNLATLSATVGEIRTLAKQTRAEREEQLKTALDEMEAQRTGRKSEYKGSVGVRFGVLGGKVEGAYANASEEEKATRRKQERKTSCATPARRQSRPGRPRIGSRNWKSKGRSPRSKGGCGTWSSRWEAIACPLPSPASRSRPGARRGRSTWDCRPARSWTWATA